MKDTLHKEEVHEQYKTAENLNLRQNLHSYNINKTDWDIWCFRKMSFPDKARILELGCGNGMLWYKNRADLNEDRNITLSDFSSGMLESTKKRLEGVNCNFKYEVIDAQNIPYGNESFDVVIARHMLYLVPDIEKALSEIKRVLTKQGIFYATTNGHDAMAELNKLIEEFDPKLGLNNNGMCYRFELENGQELLKKHFNRVETEVLEGKIVVDHAEPVVSYKASGIKGKEVLTGEKKQKFTRFVENYIMEKGSLSITTKPCILKAADIL